MVLKELYVLGAIIFLIVSLNFLYFALLERTRITNVNNFYKRLYSLTLSLKMEIKQGGISLQKRVKSVKDLEEGLQQLELALEQKTGEYRKKTNELKKKQTEVMRQNKELSAAYEALKESRERYEKLVHNLEEEYFFYGQDLKGNITYASPSVQKILGYGVNEFRNKFSGLLTESDINKQARVYMQETLQGQAFPKFIAEVNSALNEPRILELLEVPQFNTNKELVSVECLAHDITERYYAEELIRQQEEKYRQIFNSASDFIFVYEVDNRGKPNKIIEANDYTLKVLGYSQEELAELSPDDLVAAEIWSDSHERRIGEKYERIWELKSGQVINVELSEHFIKDKNKTACIAVGRDITDRKRAIEEVQFVNEELINQKENLEALIDNLTQAQEQLVQSEKMAALGQLIAGVAHEINTPLGAIKASVGNLSDSLDSALEQLPSLFQSQSKENLDLFIKTFELARGKKSELSSREKREKKRAIRKGLKEQGIESPELIADILNYLDIHDDYECLVGLFKQNNAVAVLKNVRDFISLMKNTNTIFIASEKASKVTFALKKYAHRDTLGEKVPTDIIDGLDTVLTLYDNQLKQGIEVIRKYQKLPLAMCYQDEINQVWTNLIQNALHAMKNNGTLTLEAHADEQNISVCISDSGEGIEPNIIDNIFDPFFTTKKQGEGSGLGLDIVKKIVDKHNGNISVQSQIGEGTTFKIVIPIA